MTLSDQQLSFFDTFGYLGFPGLLADRIEAISTAFEAVFAERGGGHQGKQHDGTARSCIVPFIDQSDLLSALLDDPRILGIATSLLGDDFNYMGSDGNYYVGDTGWHSDGWHPTQRHMKIAFYLDPVARDTGALRVIPGSHRSEDGYAQALQSGIYKSDDNWSVTGRDIPAIALETQPGDIVCFNHNTKHAAFGGSNRRRMFTINLCERYSEDSLQELRNYISGSARFWIDSMYGDTMKNTASPQRMRHLKQVLDNEGHLPELAAKAREEMQEPSRG
jgi:hypothetical protein